MTKEEFLALLHGLKTSGSTVKEYCKQNGISMSTYCYWKRKLKDTEPPCGLVPVQVCSDCQVGPTLLAEVLLQKYEYHQPMYHQVQQYRHFESALEENKASDKELQQLLPQQWIKSHPEAAITEVQ